MTNKTNIKLSKDEIVFWIEECVIGVVEKIKAEDIFKYFSFLIINKWGNKIVWTTVFIHTDVYCKIRFEFHFNCPSQKLFIGYTQFTLSFSNSHL